MPQEHRDRNTGTGTPGQEHRDRNTAAETATLEQCREWDRTDTDQLGRVLMVAAARIAARTVPRHLRELRDDIAQEARTLLLTTLRSGGFPPGARVGAWMQVIVTRQVARALANASRDGRIAAGVSASLHAQRAPGGEAGLRARLRRLAGDETWLSAEERAVVIALQSESEVLAARRLGVSRSALRRRAESILRRGDTPHVES